MSIDCFDSRENIFPGIHRRVVEFPFSSSSLKNEKLCEEYAPDKRRDSRDSCDCPGREKKTR